MIDSYKIANPIYDVVFKYLMEDNKIAKLIISKIIEMEVVELEFLPTERTFELKNKSLTVYRLDFAAKIKTSKNISKIVLIEIQKAKFSTDIMRFRKYLGEQYCNEENTYTEIVNKKKTKKARPLISIYFLGHKLNNIDASLIKIKRNYFDSITGEKIKFRDDFIESLTHDSFIIQIPCLKARRRNDVEILLSIFDQENSSSDNHILSLDEDQFPEELRPIIRRLQRAISEEEIRATMDIEDEILEELEDKERTIAEQQEQIFEKDKVIEEKDKVIGNKDKAIEEKDKAIEELKNKLNKLKGSHSK